MSERLVSFLYVLLRDELAAGVVERIVLEHVEKAQSTRRSYSNPHLEAYARDLAGRLSGARVVTR